MPSSTRSFVLCGLFAALVALMAQISIPLPFSPVPITGQVFGVFLVGALLGGRWGACSLLVYILTGAAGFPVFHHFQGGVHILLGPTGGYLWGFVLGGYLLGRYTEKRHTYLSLLTGMAFCLFAIYTLGTLQLSFISGLAWRQALMIGVIPFIPLDIVKIFAAAGLILAVKDRLFKVGLLPSIQTDSR